MPRGEHPAQPGHGGAPAAGGGDRGYLRRALSQNFLRDAGARQFLSLVAADPVPLAVEVGAGEGVLTGDLARRYPRVLAYEVDPAMAQRLRNRVAAFGNVRVIVGDFLAARPPREPFQVVGNVPFSITSAIVSWCLRADRLTSATIITQAEFAKKRSGAYGRWTRLTIMTWPEFSWELRGQIRRSEFRPVPKVDAGVLCLTRRPEPLIPAARLAAYRRMVELGFTGLGGTLSASLRRSYSAGQVTAAFRDAGLDRHTVVAFVTPDQWLRLFAALEPRDGAARPGAKAQPEAPAAGREVRRRGRQGGRPLR